jgi:putative transposase
MVGTSGHEPGSRGGTEVTAADRQAAAARQRRNDIALWRWALVEPAMDPALTSRQRGLVVRDLASREHAGPDGKKVSVSRRTLDRWVVARREEGFGGLVPSPRQCPPRLGTDTEELAAGLKMENPARTAAQVRRILAAQGGAVPSLRTIQRWLEARELTTRPGGAPPEAFGRFQADAVNEIWTADFMNGPRVGGKPSFLAGIIDDRSRFLTGARFVRRTDAVRFAGVLRAAIAACGIPSSLYCDHGSAFVDSSLERACAVLGIRLTHSQPGRPMGRGKIERAFGVIQQQFLAEIAGDPDGGSPARHPVASLEELNGLLAAWLRTVYHARPHSETGQAPAARLAAAGQPALPDPALLREAFSWSVIRQVRKTGTVSVEGNVYSVDPFLTGRKIECVFDPFDMTELTVYWQGRKVGKAVPQVIGRHAHPKAPPDEDDPAPAELTGIDYLQLVADADAAALAGELRLSALDGTGPEPPDAGARDDSKPGGEEDQR